MFVLKVSDVLSSDDKVEGSKLSAAFDITCEAWKVKNIFELKYLKHFND